MTIKLSLAERRAAFEVVTLYWTPPMAAPLRAALLADQPLSESQFELVREAARIEESRSLSLDNALALRVLLAR